MEYELFKGEKIAKIGFGTWRMGGSGAERAADAATMRFAYERYGVTLIDTAEMYADGEAERTVGEFVSSVPRESLFIVDKILPENAKAGRYEQCCRQSLARVGTEYFDLYLLHWREDVDLQQMVDGMERLVALGLIRHWGVSNFDAFEMEELFACRNGENCFANQCLYNLLARGVEYDLIPWCREHGVLFMAYSPLGNESAARSKMAENANVLKICRKYGITPEAAMLAFTIQNGGTAAVFKTSSLSHLKGNMEGAFTRFDEEDRALLDESFPEPKEKIALEKI